MMIISTSIGTISEKYSDKEAIKMVKEAGFDAYDFNFDRTSEPQRIFGGDYAAYAKELREYADSLGIICNQAHSISDTSLGDPKKDEELYNNLIKEIEFASILGAKNIVVHPHQHLFYPENAKKLFEMNMEFFKSLVPYCERFGITVAIENMWHENPITKAIIDSTCARAWEFCQYVDTVDSKWIKACLDVGHVSLTGADIPTFIKALGKDRLKALHIHDTDYVGDLHTLPMTQKMDFVGIMEALKEIGYEGDFTYEAGEFYRGFPVDFYPEVTEFMAKVARRLVAFAE